MSAAIYLSSENILLHLSCVLILTSNQKMKSPFTLNLLGAMNTFTALWSASVLRGGALLHKAVTSCSTQKIDQQKTDG